MPNSKEDLHAAQDHGAEHEETHEMDAAHLGAVEQEFSFDQLFNHLANHHQFAILGFHFDTPIIIYDANYGVKFYSGRSAMEEEGLFTLKPLKQIDEFAAKKVELEAEVAQLQHSGEQPHLKNKEVELEKAITQLHKYQHDAQTGHHEYALVEAKAPFNAPDMDFSLTGLVCYQWLAMIIITTLFAIAAKRYKKNPMKAPKGVQNLIESMVMFVRDDIARPNIPGNRIADGLLPYFVTLFFFILVMNLVGLLPLAQTPTGSVSVTLGLAVTAYLVIQVTAMKNIGIGAWMKHFLGGAPVWLFPIMVPIEIISMFVKPFALTIRLFANMTAGHVILLSLVGLIFYFKSWMIVGVSIPFSIFMYMLELLVAFLQAYIFTILTAVFVGLAIGDHGDHDEAHSH